MRVEPATVRHIVEVTAPLRRLPGSAARRIKLVPAENLHATIKFLGATGDDQVADVTAALDAVAAVLPATPVLLAGFGAFPSPARPRIVFAGAGVGHEHLALVALSVEEAVAALGFPREERVHVPHVTVARVDQARPHGPLSDWLAQAPREGLGALVATHLVLFESRTGAPHSVYTSLAELPLRG
jgi:2'-5' RNA ligase